MVLLDLGSLEDILNILYLIFTILIFVVGFYVHFKIEKDQKIFLIALGFLFFFIAALASFNLGGNFFFGVLDNDILTPWSLTFNFLGVLVVLIAVEPWKALRK
jgi:hypothetical protein